MNAYFVFILSENDRLFSAVVLFVKNQLLLNLTAAY